METEDNAHEEYSGPEVEIYSKTAIWWFSIIFSPIFGAVLLMLNLNAAGYKKEILRVLTFTLAWFLMSGLIVSNIPLDPRFTGLALNIIGGGILAEYFFKKYFPDKDYFPKSIIIPVIISLLIELPLVVVQLHKMGIIKY